MSDLLFRMNQSVQKAEDAAQATFDVLTGAIDVPVTVNGNTIPTLSTRMRDYLDSLIVSGDLRGDDGVGVESIDVRDQHLFVKLHGLPEEDLGRIVPDDAVGVESANIGATSGNLSIALTDGQTFNVGRVTGTNAPRITGANITDADLIFSFSDGSEINAGDVAQFAGLSATGADITETGDLVIIYADGSVKNLGRVVGARGANGESIVAGFVDPNGFLRFLKNDGSTFNTGLVSTTVVDGSSIEVQGARLDGDDLVLELTTGDYYVGSVRGTDGTDGTDGVGVEDVYIDDDDGNLYVTLTGQQPQSVGKVQYVTVEGSDISVLDASVNSDGELEVEFYLSGNTEFRNLGRVLGNDGNDGTIFTQVEVNGDGELIFTDDDGNSINAGGIDQISVTGARIDQDSSHLFIELSDGGEIDVGEIERGVDGIDGEGVDGAYISDGDLYLTFTDSNIPDASVGRVIAPIETSALLSSNGDLTITLSDGQDFDLGNVRGDDGVFIDSAEVVEGELILQMSDGTTKNVGQIEKDPTDVSVTDDGRLRVDFSDDTYIETTERVESRDGDTIEDIYFDGHDLVIDVSTDNNNTTEKVTIPAVYGYSITAVTLDESSRTLSIENNLDDTPISIEIPKGIDGDSVTDVKFDGNDVLISATIDGTLTTITIPAVKGETIENISIDADGNLVFDVSGEDEPIVFETIKGVDAVETIDDIYLDGNDLVIVKPDETLVVPGVRGEDGNTITTIEYSDNDLSIQTSDGDSVTIPAVRGIDAPTIQSVDIDANEDMIVTLSDATEFTVTGVGASVVDAQIDADGKLELTFSNGEILTTDDPVVGRDGFGTGVSDVDFVDGSLTVTLRDVAGNETTIDAGDVSMVEVSDVRLVPEDDEQILYIDFSDGSEKRIGNVKGSDGRYVVSASVDVNDDLILVMDDDSEINAGNVRGADGRSVDRIEVLLTGDLIIYYDDGETKLAGNIGAGLGLTVWEDSETYNKDRVVIHDGGLYLSLEDGNTDEPPTDKWVALALGDQITEVRRPVILSPTEGESAYSRRPTIMGSKYAPIVSSDSRDYREIQISETSNFDSPVYEVQVDDDRHEVTLDLDATVTYHVRMRDVSERGFVSAWSDVEAFAVPEGTIETPSVSISSLEDRNAAFASPEFEATPFNNEFNHELHKETDWQVIDDETDDIVWESLSDESNLNSIIVPFGNLVEAKTYVIRVRHRADTVESPWSDGYTFTTQGSFDYIQTPVIFYDGDDPEQISITPTFVSSSIKKTEDFSEVSDGVAVNHVTSDWQVALGPNGEIVEEVYETTGVSGSARLKYAMDTVLESGIDYYIRVRQNSDRFGSSEWSDWFVFSTLQYIDQPTVSTEDDVNDFPNSGTFVASEFGGVNEEHISTTWEVRDFYSDELINSATVAVESEDSRVSEYQFYTPMGYEDRDMKIRVRYTGIDVHSPWSDWFTFRSSEETAFLFFTTSVNESGQGIVRKYSPTGDLLWEYLDNNNSFEGIDLDSESNIYASVRSSDETVFKIGPSGELIWARDPSRSFRSGMSPPRVSLNDNVYIAGWSGLNTGWLLSLDSDGDERFAVNAGGYRNDPMSVCVDEEENVYVGESDGARAFKFDQNGNQIWSSDDTMGNNMVMAVTGDGLYAGQIGGYIRFIHRDSGVTLWTLSSRSPSYAACDAEGYLYTRSSTNVAKIATDSTVMWETDVGNFIRSVCVDPQGNVYAAMSTGKVIRLDGENGDIVWEMDVIAGLTNEIRDIVVEPGRAFVAFPSA